MIDQLNKVLAGQRIKGTCVSTETHRHLTFFDVKLDPGARINRIETCAREIACGMNSEKPPIIKVMSKQGIVRLQFAMEEAKCVKLGSLFRGEPVPQQMTFPMLLGETDDGRKLWADMAKSPHLLIAGTTGSGKSVLLHNIIANVMVMNAVRHRCASIHLIDPKQTEFVSYQDADIPCIQTVICENDEEEDIYQKAVTLLGEMVNLMDERYSELRRARRRSVDEAPREYIQHFIVIDEVADLLMQDSTGILRDLIVRLAQKARAAGIYLVLATQRPTKDMFPTTLKANFGRIACRTTSSVESMVVLDMVGAEKLLGRGDAIMRNMEHDNVRFQVAYIMPESAIKLYNNLRHQTIN